MERTITFDVPATLAAAAPVLEVGRRLVDAIPILKRYSIPAAVVGGLIAAGTATVLHAPGADLRLLAGGGKMLFTFGIAIAVMLVLQNLVGVGAAK
jgi:ESS family glutamate:Na+ symporter